MRALLELHARGLQLRHLAERLHALPVGALTEMGIAPPQPEAAPVSFTTPRRLPWLLLISAAVIFCRPLTKTLVSAPHPIGRSHPRHSAFSAHHALAQRGCGLLALRRLRLAEHGSLGSDLIFGSRGCSAVLIALIRLGQPVHLTTVALALILGGALGNLHDRIVYGSVVDFIEVHIFSYHWPDFNVADSAIVTGACLLLLDSLLPKKDTAPVSNLSA